MVRSVAPHAARMWARGRTAGSRQFTLNRVSCCLVLGDDEQLDFFLFCMRLGGYYSFVNINKISMHV